VLYQKILKRFPVGRKDLQLASFDKVHYECHGRKKGGSLESTGNTVEVYCGMQAK
jgi:hypothetical protein